MRFNISGQVQLSFSRPANSRNVCGTRILPCLSSSQFVAPATKKRVKVLAFLFVSGKALSFSSKAFHSSIGKYERQPSSPLVSTNSSPRSSSLNLEGMIRLPLRVDCMIVFAHEHLDYTYSLRYDLSPSYDLRIGNGESAHIPSICHHYSPLLYHYIAILPYLPRKLQWES